MTYAAFKSDLRRTQPPKWDAARDLQYVEKCGLAELSFVSMAQFLAVGLVLVPMACQSSGHADS